LPAGLSLMAKLEAQGRSATIRSVKSDVKRELHEDGPRRGYARDPKEHFHIQVSLINEVVRPPWCTCFGSLGTGIVGVRPEGDSATGGADMFGARLACSETGSSEIPLDATIVIFVAAPSADLQTRGSRAMGGYKDDLDKVARTLDWSAQRGDLRNKKLTTIMSHVHGGGRVVVAVRSNLTKRFTLLGTVSHIDAFCGARFLVEDGEHILQERGTRTYHKQITAACLNSGLRSGVGLREARYPVPTGDHVKFCLACCYAPSKATLHFHELRDEGVSAYSSPAHWVRRREREQERQRLARIKVAKSERCKGENKLKAKVERGKVDRHLLAKAKLELDNIAKPLKRLRCKQPLKREALEPATDATTVPDAGEGGQVAGTAEAAEKEAALETPPALTPDVSAAEGGKALETPDLSAAEGRKVAEQGHLEPSCEDESIRR